MGAVVIEHVKVGDLPEAWRARVGASQEAWVTVRIEEEAANEVASAAAGEDLLFGMWRDREDMADVEAYVRKLRAPRYNRDGSRNESGNALGNEPNKD
jgi:hypothetical protein